MKWQMQRDRQAKTKRQVNRCLADDLKLMFEKKIKRKARVKKTSFYEERRKVNAIINVGRAI